MLFFVLDKMCDQISDAVLDAHLKQDPNAKVACGKFCVSCIIQKKKKLKQVVWWFWIFLTQIQLQVLYVAFITSKKNTLNFVLIQLHLPIFCVDHIKNVKLYLS